MTDDTVREIENLIANGYVSDSQRERALDHLDALCARAEAAERDAEAWRGFAIDVAREVAPVGAEDSAHQTSVGDLPALLKMVRGAGEQHAMAIARAEAAEAALATARAEGVAAERAAIVSYLRDHREVADRSPGWGVDAGPNPTARRFALRVCEDIADGAHVRPVEGA